MSVIFFIIFALTMLGLQKYISQKAEREEEEAKK